MAGDGSLLLVGSTTGDWDGVSAGEDDFAAVKLDSESDEDWRWQVRNGNGAGESIQVSLGARKRVSTTRPPSPGGSLEHAWSMYY